jgi:hypothetical protein
MEEAMKTKLLALLTALLVLPIAAAMTASAKTPLYGQMDLYWNDGFGDTSTACPAIDWAGNIDIDGTMYGMTFVPAPGRETGTAFHFFEDWAIYDETFTFTGGVLTNCIPGDVLLAGDDFGLTGANSKYRMNGTVYTAEELFEDWIGRPVHMDGLILWKADGSPAAAPGMFRLH